MKRVTLIRDLRGRSAWYAENEDESECAETFPSHGERQGAAESGLHAAYLDQKDAQAEAKFAEHDACGRGGCAAHKTSPARLSRCAAGAFRVLLFVTYDEMR
jgi:hypothetical protein